MFCSTFLVVAILPSIVWGDDTCITLKPASANNLQVGRGPFSLNLNPNAGIIDVVLNTNEELFYDFVIQARDGRTDAVLGSFSTSEFSLLDCSGIAGSTVNQKQSSGKSQIDLKWNIPDGLVTGQKIVFKANVVLNNVNGDYYSVTQSYAP